MNTFKLWFLLGMILFGSAYIGMGVIVLIAYRSDTLTAAAGAVMYFAGSLLLVIGLWLRQNTILVIRGCKHNLSLRDTIWARK